MKRLNTGNYILIFISSITLLIVPNIFARDSTPNWESLVECEQEVLKIVNTVRQNHSPSLPPLQLDSNLNITASRHGRDMLTRSYFDHISPDGDNPHQRITEQHRHFIIHSTGENIWSRIFKGSFDPEPVLAQQMMDDWMNSPPHRRILLTPEYTHIGISVLRQQDQVIAVQHFVFSKGQITPPLPEILLRGSTLNLGVESNQLDLQNPKRFDLVNSSSLKPVCEPTYLRIGRLHCKSGQFRFRLYFLAPDEKQWDVYLGPLVRVP